MTRASLWLEMVIAGTPLLATVWFAVLGVLRISSLFSLQPEDAYLPYIGATVVVSAYLAGLVAHRVAEVLFGRFRQLRRALGIGQTNTADETFALMVDLWSHASERINQELDRQYSATLLLRSLTVSVPLLGISVSAWMFRTDHPLPLLPLAIGAIVAVPIGVAARRQQFVFLTTRDLAKSSLAASTSNPNRIGAPSNEELKPTAAPSSLVEKENLTPQPNSGALG